MTSHMETDIDPIDISIVVPMLNEEGSVEPLIDGIRDALGGLDIEYEVILVDDGSTDATFQQMRSVQSRDRRVEVLKLTRNFGQTPALKAGIVRARGRIIITMDGDLQNDPIDIPQLLAKIDEGYDMVAGWRERRKDRFFSRTMPSRVANWMIRKSTGTSIRDNGCALRAYRAEVIKTYPLYSEMHRLLPTMMAMSGARITEIPVKHHSRRFGESKYGLSRTYKVLLDLLALKTILTFHRSPLFGFGFPAVLFGFVGIALLGFGTWQIVIDPEGAVLVYPGVGLLLVWMSVSFGTLGIICDMLYATGDVKVRGQSTILHEPS